MNKKLVILSIILGLFLFSMVLVNGCKKEANAASDDNAVNSQLETQTSCPKSCDPCPTDCKKECCEAKQKEGTCPLKGSNSSCPKVCPKQGNAPAN